MYRRSLWLVSFVWLLTGCHNNGSGTSSGPFVPDPSGASAASVASEVIYALRLPTDIAGLFEETGTGFMPQLLIPPERIPLSGNPGKMALLMGALGADLSYCKLFERVNESAEGYRHLELLADRLELPAEIFEKSASQLELYLRVPDSLTALLNQVYLDVDHHFREHQQESLASLSLLGGWLEAMYIGVGIYRERSVLEMGDRILLQKYALNSLTGLLANHQDALQVRRYMHSLQKLKKAYDRVHISYTQEGFRLNQEKRTFEAAVAGIACEPETLEQICEIISGMRSGMID